MNTTMGLLELPTLPEDSDRAACGTASAAGEGLAVRPPADQPCTTDAGSAEIFALPYRATPHGLAYVRPMADGPVLVPLTNFTAEITHDILEDDDAGSPQRLFALRAQLGERTCQFTVPAAVFPSLRWVTTHLGARAIVLPGPGVRDHTRAAIQALSTHIMEQHRYVHLGWRRIDGTWLYLVAGGAIGAHGWVTTVDVRLAERPLQAYCLPAPPTGTACQEAVQASLGLATLAPTALMVPLLGAAYRAPLGVLVPNDFSLFLSGPTGVFKTELTALIQAHFGAGFHGKNLPGHWASTANTLEKLAFLAKDAVFVIDDFAPTGTSADVARLHREADRLLRGQGNQGGRGRMGPDGRLRIAYYPRGAVLASGEDVPRGQSLRARMLILEVTPGMVPSARLAAAQAQAGVGVFAAAMAAYLHWLAPRLDTLRSHLPARQRTLRAQAHRDAMHARTPDIVASLALGWEVFLAFAVDIAVLSAAQARTTWTEIWQTLGEVAARQGEHETSEDPVQRFLGLLTAVLTSGQAHIADATTHAAPPNPTHWGWVGNPRDGWRARGKRIGWLEETSLLLEPEAAFAAVQQLAQAQRLPLPLPPRTLWKRMAEAGLLASRDPVRGKNVVRWTIAGQRRYVLHLSSSVLSLG